MVFVSDETKDGEKVQVRDTKRTIQKNNTFILSLDCISNTKTTQYLISSTYQQQAV